jgi:hypothetical protein
MRIVFERKPDSPDLVFVEVEDDTGHSIQAGTWEDAEPFVVLQLP